MVLTFFVYWLSPDPPERVSARSQRAIIRGGLGFYEPIWKSCPSDVMVITVVLHMSAVISYPHLCPGRTRNHRSHIRCFIAGQKSLAFMLYRYPLNSFHHVPPITYVYILYPGYIECQANIHEFSDWLWIDPPWALREYLVLRLWFEQKNNGPMAKVKPSGRYSRSGWVNSRSWRGPLGDGPG